MKPRKISLLRSSWRTRRSRAGARMRPRRSEVLELLGLQDRRSQRSIFVTGLGLLGAGALVGAGLTLVFAPGLLLHRSERA
jgi:hypothetical protein